jgi:MoCo/4Fe-4S cofactor protein with predicted Tat translocation signal
VPPIKHHISGIEYWRSLEQLSDSAAVRQLVDNEFPGYDPVQLVGSSRRSFMKLMGASLALAGLTLTGCRRWPKEEVIPYASNPKDRVPGIPERYATVMELGGIGIGLLVSCYDGRPIKIEGNPDHPFARTAPGLGAADAFAQASVLEMYDPDRSRSPVDHTKGGNTRSTWDAFSKAVADYIPADGAGVAILSEATSSPSALEMKKLLLTKLAKAKWYEYEPISADNESLGAKLAFGKPLRPLLKLEKASVIVSLDADLLGLHPAHVRYAADWASGRRSSDQGRMNRMYVAESCFSLTGTMADERLPLRPSRLNAVALALAAKLGVEPAAAEPLSGDEAKFVQLAAADLKTNAGKGVIAAAAHLPPELHALAYAMNAKIGAFGQTLEMLDAPELDRPTHTEAIAALTNEMKGGRINTLLILGGNPVYDALADLDFGKALSGVANSIHLSVYQNETSQACKWHLPRAHYLEAWGDARAFDGTVSVAQPMIEPLFGGKSLIELLALLAGDTVNSGGAIVRRTVATMLGGSLDGADKDLAFRRALHDGVILGTAAAAFNGTPRSVPLPAAVETTGLEIRFQPDASMLDGRFANSGWLQEMPDPLTKLTWDNAALISKKDADVLGVNTGDMVRITVDGRSLDIVGYILPGQPVGVIGLPLGYGRSAAGNVGNDLGFNTYQLRTTKAMSAAAAQVQKTGRAYKLAMTQDHHIIDEVGAAARSKRVGEKGHSGMVVREASFEEYKTNPQVALPREHRAISLPLFDPPARLDATHAWGMAIDMNSCIGCNACVVACQAENNIPVVGKKEVANSREMHWIRIDRYFKGAAGDANPQVVYQPMMCVHCENAPCEEVCPVAATAHDTEGLNTMVYNRCIGTRYCSNNCPYKVRRFNYFDFHSKSPRQETALPWVGMPDSQQKQSIDPIKQMLFNPDVTVRMRGVMEKCSYCVQRIHAVKINVRNDHAQGQRDSDHINDGEIATACQQTCPTQAIIFGDLNDPAAQVTKLHRHNRAYSVLDEELATKPRTRHLAKLRNPVETATAPELAAREKEHNT